jgi:cytochrome-b5 reductase
MVIIFRYSKIILISTHVDGNEIQRSYTPISLPTEEGGFEVLLKVYPQGKMSSFVHGLKVGEEISVKGMFTHPIFLNTL